jgi:hypothetical protein
MRCDGCLPDGGDRVRLTARADIMANLFEEEESGQPIG